MQTVLVFLSVLVAIYFLREGYRGRQKSTSLRRLFLYDEKLTLGRFVGTLAATNFSLGNMIYFALIWGFFFGLGALLWLWIGFFLAAFVFWIFFKKGSPIRTYVTTPTNSGSVHEYLEQRYSMPGKEADARCLRFVASLTTIGSLLVALSLEIYLGASLLAPLLDADPTTVFVVMAVIIGAYSALGGFWAVVMTDIAQGVSLIVAAGCIIWVVILLELPLSLSLYSEAGYPSDPVSIFSAPGLAGVVSIIGITGGWYLVTMDTWQRACASRNANTYMRGLGYGQIPIFAGILLFCFLGAYNQISLVPALEPSQVDLHSGGFNTLTDFLLFVDRLPSWSEGLMAIFSLAFVLAAFSTADTFLLVCGHSFVSGVMPGAFRRESVGELDGSAHELLAGVGRAVVVFMGLGVVGVFFALSSSGLLEDPLLLFYLAYSVQFSLLAPVVFSRGKTRPPPRAALFALIASLLVSIGWGFGFALTGNTWLADRLGITLTDVLYLTPIPTQVVGILILTIAFVFRTRSDPAPARN